jgi:hypothetical protein
MLREELGLHIGDEDISVRRPGGDAVPSRLWYF